MNKNLYLNGRWRFDVTIEHPSHRTLQRRIVLVPDRDGTAPSSGGAQVSRRPGRPHPVREGRLMDADIFAGTPPCWDARAARREG